MAMIFAISLIMVFEGQGFIFTKTNREFRKGKRKIQYIKAVGN